MRPGSAAAGAAAPESLVVDSSSSSSGSNPSPRDFPDFERPQQALVARSGGKRRHVSPPLRNLERLFQLDPWRRWGAGAFLGGGGAESARSCQLAPTPPSAWTLDQHTLCRCGKTSGALRTLSIAAGSSDGRRPRHEGPRKRKLQQRSDARAGGVQPASRKWRVSLPFSSCAHQLRAPCRCESIGSSNPPSSSVTRPAQARITH